MLNYYAMKQSSKAAAKRYNPADRCALYEALCDYATEGIMPDWPEDDIKWFAWDSMVQDIEAAEANAEKNRVNGGKGGRPAKPKETEDNPAKPTETEKTQNNPENPTEPTICGYTETETETETETYIKTDNKKRTRTREENKEIVDRFTRFWTAYPRKTAKEAALKAFAKLKPDETLLQTMLEALDRWKASDQWTRDGGQFVPHPATWINGKRWEDEVPKAAAPRKTVPAQQYEQRDYSSESEEIPQWAIERARQMGVVV